MKFRRARAADIAAIVDLVESAYRGEPSRAGWTTEADLLAGQRTDAEDVRSCIDGERSMILLAEAEGELAACANVAAEVDAGYFGMFAVIPRLQRGGVGKAVLAEAERIVRDEWHLPAMRMTVIDVRAELIAFYERRGYTRTGVKKPFPYGDERFGQPRRADLRFEVLEKRFAAEVVRAPRHELESEPPVVARLVIEIRSDGSRTIARGALEDVTTGQRTAIEAKGDSPLALAIALARSLTQLPKLATRSAVRGLLGRRKRDP